MMISAQCIWISAKTTIPKTRHIHLCTYCALPNCAFPVPTVPLHPKTSPTHAAMAPPIPPNPPTNRPSQPTNLPCEPRGSRCEISPKVRTIAQRTQTRMFQRTGLFFNEATFQVPNTVEEAFENMHIGTADLDKNDSESTEGVTDLYLLSWSNTQFFSAQMAALGFRFISCNLRKKPGLKQPPAVDKWLRLERFSAPLTRQPPPGTQTPSAPQQSTPAPPHTTANLQQTNSAPAPNVPLPPVRNQPNPSNPPQLPRPAKRPQPPQPSLDRIASPPIKTQRGPNGIRTPSQPRSSPNSSRQNVTSSGNKAPHNSTQSSVPVIDLT